jgi:hypothetical protein
MSSGVDRNRLLDARADSILELQVSLEVQRTCDRSDGMCGDARWWETVLPAGQYVSNCFF